MLSSYYPGGRASALEIRNDAKFTAAYMDQQVVLLEPAAVSLREGVPDPPASVEYAVRISKGLPLQMSPSRTVLHKRTDRDKESHRKRILRVNKWSERAVRPHPG